MARKKKHAMQKISQKHFFRSHSHMMTIYSQYNGYKGYTSFDIPKMCFIVFCTNFTNTKIFTSSMSGAKDQIFLGAGDLSAYLIWS